MIGAPKNGPQRCSSIASLHKNGFGLEKFRHKPALNLLPWPEEGLVYIYLKLVTISELPPKIWPQKGPNIPQYWPNIFNNMHNLGQKIGKKTHLCKKIKLSPLWLGTRSKIGSHGI
jgi:hypothetical protein